MLGAIATLASLRQLTVVGELTSVLNQRAQPSQ